MTEIEIKLAEKNGVLDEVYGQTVDRFVRERYTVSKELSAMRQKDEKPDEFAAYYAYVEECKKRAKSEVYGDDN